jgi:hypothetical protein
VKFGKANGFNMLGDGFCPHLPVLRELLQQGFDGVRGVYGLQLQWRAQILACRGENLGRW